MRALRTSWSQPALRAAAARAAVRHAWTLGTAHAELRCVPMFRDARLFSSSSPSTHPGTNGQSECWPPTLAATAILLHGKGDRIFQRAELIRPDLTWRPFLCRDEDIESRPAHPNKQLTNSRRTRSTDCCVCCAVGRGSSETGQTPAISTHMASCLFIDFRVSLGPAPQYYPITILRHDT